ncbi:response regulator transcription factor [Anaerolineales bacterium HSG25]|nr:response regulator transcription factor [Anaerolineales bacterium HSG25]
MANSQLLLIADDPLVRAGLAALLTTEESVRLVGQTDSANALSDLTLYQPDVVLWDLGWETPTKIPANLPPLAEQLPLILLLTVDDDETSAIMPAELLNLSVSALLPRNVRLELLLTAITTVRQGLLVLDPMFRHLIKAPTLSPSGYELTEPLTQRETEVLQLLAEGLANKTIARRLDISDNTVKFHVKAILTKLNAESRTEAVVRATRLGLILL